VEPRQRHELEAIERHIGMEIALWSSGAHAAPPPVQAPPRRHEKPHVGRTADEPKQRLIIAGGRLHGIDVAQLVSAITRATGLDGEAISDVIVLERFSLLSVAAAESERVIEALEGSRVADRVIRAEPVGAREPSEV
jgi:ATP-dependent RNA helicase DeaD